jgi:GT2 family glycosyltransferase
MYALSLKEETRSPDKIEPEITIVVSPRERFSVSRQSLNSIYEHTSMPFKLIYVDGGSPAPIRRYVEAQAKSKGFHLIRTNHFLSPNRARNLGLRHVDTKYVVFIDNDVIVAPNWLESLLCCAEETGAAIVSPLVCEGIPIHQTVHCAGGETGVRLETEGTETKRRMIEKIHLHGCPVEKLRDTLQRKPTQLAEFHCMMVRTEFFERIGFLDEQLMNSKEHLDLCIAIEQAGGTIYLEPNAIVTYVTAPITWMDIPYYMLRWSDAWELQSLTRLREKWDLTEDKYFRVKYKSLGWRRSKAILKPLVHKFTFGKGSLLLEKTLTRVDKWLNQQLTTRYAQKYLQHPDSSNNPV